MIDDRAPHYEGPILLTTAQLADKLGISAPTVRNNKSKYRDCFIEGQHFTRDEFNNLLWTEAGEALMRQACDGTITAATPQNDDPITAATPQNDDPITRGDDQGVTLDQFADEMAAAIARDIVWAEVRKRIPSAITREIIRLLSLADAKAEFQGIAAEWISPLQSQALDSAVRIQVIQASSNGHHKALTGGSDA